jgi:phospholipase D1/2
MPFLLPPPDFKQQELIDDGLTGTCELQICRSAGPWSLGTLGKIEHSIQNAYLKGNGGFQICDTLPNLVPITAIQLSEHFVYIENQFFITSWVVLVLRRFIGLTRTLLYSTVINDVPIENRIGDALVHRIIRAHREGTKWKAVILIPLLPGFPSPIDQGEASAVCLVWSSESRESTPLNTCHTDSDNTRMSKSNHGTGSKLHIFPTA